MSSRFPTFKNKYRFPVCKNMQPSLEIVTSTLIPDEQELVNKIHIYDRAFDINRWKKNVEEKRQIEEKVRKSLLNPIYQFISDNKMVLTYDPSNSMYDVYSAGLSIKKLILSLIDMFKSIGINVTLQGDYMLKVPNILDIHRELFLISLIKGKHDLDQWEEGYLTDLVNAKEVNIDILHIRDVLSTSDTLSNHLQCEISREEKLSKIRAMKEHTLFLMLEKYKWRVYKNLILGIFVDDGYGVNQIYKELMKLYGYKIRADLKNNEFTITNEGRLALIEINKFYYPCIYRYTDIVQ